MNDTGRQQAARLPHRLQHWKIDAIYSSPLERALETAMPVAEELGMTVHVEIAFTEFDFGEWTGMLVSELDQRNDWKLFRAHRGSTRAPGGELITESQTRFIAALQDLSHRRFDQVIAVVSHAAPIKAVLFHYLAAPLDNVYRLDIDPASISIVHVGRSAVAISGINLVG